MQVGQSVMRPLSSLFQSQLSSMSQWPAMSPHLAAGPGGPDAASKRISPLASTLRPSPLAGALCSLLVFVNSDVPPLSFRFSLSV